VGGVNRAEGFEERKPSEKPEADKIAKGETLKGGGWASKAEGEGTRLALKRDYAAGLAAAVKRVLRLFAWVKFPMVGIGGDESPYDHLIA
jgi:hypothetical protein